VPSSEPARTTIHRVRIRKIRVAGLLVVIAVTAAVLGRQVGPSSPSTAFSSLTAASPIELDEIPGTDDLDPDLLDALRQAATAAADDGVELSVDSGRRSPERQEQLLQDAIAKYGSVEEATRWVATPETSAHVSGDAVDIGPSRAAAWLSAHGAAYGLCQIYDNEPWHYELRPEAVTHGCPPTYADPTHDPRMYQ
jgi:D-alanyl-D-alanine carboxypeptidase